MKGTSIDTERLLSLAKELVESPSENPPGNEYAVTETLLNWFDESPIDFEITMQRVESNRKNIIARAGKSDNGSVIFNGHTDVVPADASQWTGDPFTLRQTEKTLVGRGIADMKGAIAAAIIAAEAYMINSSDPGEIVLTFVVDEEYGGKGSATLVDSGIEADAAIIGEPTELKICTGQKGVARYKITIQGESAHSGIPQSGEDAILAANRIVESINEFDQILQNNDPSATFNPESMTTTEIKAGSAPNVVADKAVLTVDWRFLPTRPNYPEPFDKRIAEIVEDVHFDQQVNVGIERTVFARASDVPVDSPIVNAIKNAVDSADISVDMSSLNAATDARFLIHDANIPTVLFGPGSIQRDAHTVDESITIQEITTAAEVYRYAFENVIEKS